MKGLVEALCGGGPGARAPWAPPPRKSGPVLYHTRITNISQL